MEDRTILHIDINHCYAQIEEMKYPALRQIPMAVGGHEEARHGIILAKNDLAKKAGVLTGESLREAYDACPQLLIIPPAYDDYIYYTERVKDICRQYSDAIEPFGLDESWLDCTHCRNLYSDPLEVAGRIQQRILNEIGLTVSIGISYNKVFAKFGSDLVKPSGLTLITRDNYRQIVWPHPAEDLLFVGPATKRKLKARGIDTIGELAQYPLPYLKQAMGAAGEVIWQFANGEDRSEVSASSCQAAVKSVGNSMTMVHDVNSAEELEPVFWVLCECVASRLRDCGMEGDTVGVCMRSSGLDWMQCQFKMPQRTSLSQEIMKTAMMLIRERYDFSTPMRAAGVSVFGLRPSSMNRQLSIFTDETQREKARKTDLAMDEIRHKYGYYSIRRCCTMIDRPLTEFNPKEEHTVHPIGYFQGRKMIDGTV